LEKNTFIECLPAFKFAEYMELDYLRRENPPMLEMHSELSVIILAFREMRRSFFHCRMNSTQPMLQLGGAQPPRLRFGAPRAEHELAGSLPTGLGIPRAKVGCGARPTTPGAGVIPILIGQQTTPEGGLNIARCPMPADFSLATIPPARCFFEKAGRAVLCPPRVVSRLCLEPGHGPDTTRRARSDAPHLCHVAMSETGALQSLEPVLSSPILRPTLIGRERTFFARGKAFFGDRQR
jgi:hypothetical protein